MFNGKNILSAVEIGWSKTAYWNCVHLHPECDCWQDKKDDHCPRATESVKQAPYCSESLVQTNLKRHPEKRRTVLWAGFSPSNSGDLYIVKFITPENSSYEGMCPEIFIIYSVFCQCLSSVRICRFFFFSYDCRSWSIPFLLDDIVCVFIPTTLITPWLQVTRTENISDIAVICKDSCSWSFGREYTLLILKQGYIKRVFYSDVYTILNRI